MLMTISMVIVCGITILLLKSEQWKCFTFSREQVASFDSGAMEKIEKPKKADYRQRAHVNPLSDSVSIEYPLNPNWVDWSVHYPSFFGKPETNHLYLNTVNDPISYTHEIEDHYNGKTGARPTWLDVGCGFGGLSVTLGEKYPETLILALEIRDKVSTYVGKRILAARQAVHESSGKPLLANVACLRQNVMKNLVNYIRRGQLEKIFFCFPDPHFKKSNWRRRIINYELLSIYAYCLAPGGLIYAVTDVLDLHNWMRDSMLSHPMYKEMDIKDYANDFILDATMNSTEESKKVSSMGGAKYASIFMRIPDPKDSF